MKAFVTSVGEPTTDLCVWALERQGFEVTLIKDKTSLAQKLSVIYDQADEDFLRVDADVICNRNLSNKLVQNKNYVWWLQYQTYDWFKQDITNGGVQYIKKQALPALRANVKRFLKAERPETELYRLPEFDNPRRCVTVPIVMGLNNYAVKDIERVKRTKARRNQLESYDFELAERLEEL